MAAAQVRFGAESVSGQLSTQSMCFHQGQSTSPCPHSHDGDKNRDTIPRYLEAGDP